MITKLALVFLFWQAADPFAALEKMLAKGKSAFAERESAFTQLKTAAQGGNLVDLTRAYARYLSAMAGTIDVWLPARTELDRVSKAVKPDPKAKDRLAKLTAQVEAFMKHPAGYDEVMKQYRQRISDPDAGPQAPVIRKPKG